MFSLSNKSNALLSGVNPDLVKVVQLAIKNSSVDFTVVEGLRTKERQAQLLKQGKTQTMASMHIIGRAVDIAPIVNGTISWDLKDYFPVAKAMQDAAKTLGIKIRWGAAWSVPDFGAFSGSPKDAVDKYVAYKKANGGRPFIDAPHFELV